MAAVINTDGFSYRRAIVAVRSKTLGFPSSNLSDDAAQELAQLATERWQSTGQTGS